MCAVARSPHRSPSTKGPAARRYGANIERRKASAATAMPTQQLPYRWNLVAVILMTDCLSEANRNTEKNRCTDQSGLTEAIRALALAHQQQRHHPTVSCAFIIFA